MVIHVKKHLLGCNTNEEGELLFSMIKGEVSRNGSCTVDFHDVLYATTSFINSAFVPLLEEMTFEEVKKCIRVVRAHPQIAGAIRNRMTDENTLSAA